MANPQYIPFTDKLINLTAVNMTIVFDTTASIPYERVIQAKGALNLRALTNSQPTNWPANASPNLVCDDLGIPQSIPIIHAQKFDLLDELSPGFTEFCAVKPDSHVIVTLPVAQHLMAKPGILGLKGPIYVYTAGGGPTMTVRDKEGKPIGTRSLEYHGTIGSF